MARISQAAQEKEWQGQEDAHTLARAEQIKADPNRMKNASVQAKKMAEKARKELETMNKVAANKPSVRKVQPRKK